MINESKKNGIKKALIILFLIFEFFFFFWLILDRSNRYHEFSVLVFALIFSLCFIKSGKLSFLVVLGVFFSTIAEFFLTIKNLTVRTELDQNIAMTSFSLATISYFLFLFFETDNKKIKYFNLGSRIFLIALFEIIAKVIVKENTNYLVIISMFYFPNLIVNTVFSFINFKKHPLFSIGMLCFLCCDIVVGLQMTEELMIFSFEEGSFLESVLYPGFNLSWVFYIPSQTLIPLSLALKNKKD